MGKRWLIGAALLIGFSSAAYAHARLVRSQPAKDAQLTAAPARIDLWFSELLDDGFNAIEVVPVAQLKETRRTNLTSGDAVVDADDRTHLSVALPSLQSGSYVVEYRVLSRDGHTAPGRYTFHLRAAH